MQNTKIALITGASSGIGRELAILLIGNGFRVIGTSRKISRLGDLSERFNEMFYAHELDVTDPESANSVIERLPSELKSIEVLVNNAGSDIGGRQQFSKGNLDNWLNTIEANVNGVIRVTHAVIQGMIARNHGDIINIGSTSGLEPVPGTTAYSASKHAINGFSESLRKEHEDSDIRIMQVLPGMVRTQFAAARFGDTDKGEDFYDNFGKWLNPEDVANSVVFALKQPRHVVIPQLVIVPKTRDT
jgi:NADP-dependent 3-hydroxy acid dehydrogenase YdfG